MNEQIEKMKIDVLESIAWKDIDDGVTALDIESTTEHLRSKGYREQSEVIEEYRQKVNTKMGKHTHLLGKEYVQRILREVAKEMKGGEE